MDEKKSSCSFGFNVAEIVPVGESIYVCSLSRRNYFVIPSQLAGIADNTSTFCPFLFALKLRLQLKVKGVGRSRIVCRTVQVRLADFLPWRTLLNQAGFTTILAFYGFSGGKKTPGLSDCLNLNSPGVTVGFRLVLLDQWSRTLAASGVT